MMHVFTINYSRVDCYITLMRLFMQAITVSVYLVCHVDYHSVLTEASQAAIYTQSQFLV